MKSAIAIAAIAVVMLAAVTEAKLFNCADEFCAYNGTTNLWSCSYNGCPTQPDWVQNVTNLTAVVNLTVANCSVDMLYDYLNDYTAEIDARFNWSNLYNQCDSSLTTCRDTIAEQSGLLLGMVNSTLLEGCNDDLRQANTAREDADTGSWYKGLFGFIGGAVVVWFFMRRGEVVKSNVQPPSGETHFNPHKIDNDAELARQKTRVGELEAKLGQMSAQPRAKRQQAVQAK
jgi:hypothetical protein